MVGVGAAGDALRRRGAVRARRLSQRRVVQQVLVSVACLIGAAVSNQAGEQVGRVADLIARMRSDDSYPPLTGLMIKVGVDWP